MLRKTPQRPWNLWDQSPRNRRLTSRGAPRWGPASVFSNRRSKLWSQGDKVLKSSLLCYFLWTSKLPCWNLNFLICKMTDSYFTGKDWERSKMVNCLIECLAHGRSFTNENSYFNNYGQIHIPFREWEETGCRKNKDKLKSNSLAFFNYQYRMIHLFSIKTPLRSAPILMPLNL